MTHARVIHGARGAIGRQGTPLRADQDWAVHVATCDAAVKGHDRRRSIVQRLSQIPCAERREIGDEAAGCRDAPEAHAPVSAAAEQALAGADAQRADAGARGVTVVWAAQRLSGHVGRESTAQDCRPCAKYQDAPAARARGERGAAAGQECHAQDVFLLATFEDALACMHGQRHMSERILRAPRLKQARPYPRQRQARRTPCENTSPASRLRQKVTCFTPCVTKSSAAGTPASAMASMPPSQGFHSAPKTCGASPRWAWPWKTRVAARARALMR